MIRDRESRQLYSSVISCLLYGEKHKKNIQFKHFLNLSMIFVAWQQTNKQKDSIFKIMYGHVRYISFFCRGGRSISVVETGIAGLFRYCRALLGSFTLATWHDEQNVDLSVFFSLYVWEE